MLGLLSPEPRNDRYQTQARRSHVTPAISALGSAKEEESRYAWFRESSWQLLLTGVAVEPREDGTGELLIVQIHHHHVAIAVDAGIR